MPLASSRHTRRASVMPTDRQENRRCRVVGCGGRHVYNTLPNGSRIYSNYCDEHTCRNPRNEHVPFCINPRGPNNRYCAFHGKCRARECINQASRNEDKPYPYICPRHRCTQCTSPRFNNFSVCQAHLTCQVLECVNHPDLNHPRLFCRNHSCTMNPRCPHQAIAFTHGVSHCSHHLPCGVVRGCTRLRMRLPDGQQLPHCDEHIMCQSRSCRMLVRPGLGLSFCPTHKCSLEGCPREKDTGSLYCQRHTCFRAECTEIVRHIENNAARFCSSHECLVEACHAEAKTPNGCCESHGCTHGSCNALRKGGADYCADHRCRFDTCQHQAVNKKGFCSRHSCAKKDCRSPRLGGHDSIVLCLKHWTEDVRDRAKSEFGREHDLKYADLEDELFEYELRERRRKEAELREAEQARKADLAEKDKQRIRAEAERLKAADEARRMQEETRRAKEADRVKKAALKMVEDEKRRLKEEEERLEREEADLRRKRDREDREREADRKWAEEARRKRDRKERERMEMERHEQEARMRDRLRRPTEEFSYVPAGRRGMRRDTLHEWGL